MCGRIQKEPAELFSGRATHYTSGRPNYPEKLIGILKNNTNFGRDSIVADIGSGTGKLSSLFLGNGNEVIGIEPNDEMRDASIKELSHFKRFQALCGTAENTGLEPNSVDLVCAGQAFHWFDPGKAKIEFKRILRTEGVVCLVWNDRKLSDENPVNLSYEAVSAEYSRGYHKSGSGYLEDTGIEYFFGKKPQLFVLENIQKLDLQGFLNRYISTSYSLPPEDSRLGQALEKLRETFARHQVNGEVKMEYETKIFISSSMN